MSAEFDVGSTADQLHPHAIHRKPRFHLNRPLILAVLLFAVAPAAVPASSTGDVQEQAVAEPADAPPADQAGAAVATPPPDQVSAADRLRSDPSQTGPLPRDSNAKPRPPYKLSRDERAIARHITRSYGVDSGSSERFVHYAYKAGREFQLDPHLILGVMAVESNFDANARSSAGAKGLMQVHVKVHGSKFEPFGGPDAAYDPPANIKVGAGILSDYVNRYGDVAAGLKAYVGAALLPSDRGYGSKVLNRQAEFNAVVRPEAPVREARESKEAKEAKEAGDMREATTADTSDVLPVEESAF